MASAAGSVEVSADGSVGSPDSLVPPADRRGAEQTLLTYPEWLLVHSPSEYARMMQSEPSHEFPFVAHIGELWSSYAIVTREQLRAGYPINPGYHMMIGVIATSTTVEYGVRAVYGNTVGRISWALGGARATDEDRYDAQTAQQYVDFIRQEPWYLFNFGSRLKGLWTEVPTAGPGMIRKWERRFALTGEYGVKALYAQAIKVATHAAYAPPQMTTDVVVDRLPDDWTPPAEVKLVKRFDDGRALLSLPRYYDFRIAATALARQGLHIIDIAGNQSTILVSLWAPEGKAVEVDGARTLFTQPIRTPAHTTRVVMLVPVPKLTELLAGADDAGWTVEHVYDY
ncbi:hypothetical protein G3O01_10325 [Burkholderia sp. Ac-20365]|nr:hypothetical protein [Burkholderia sp. Ac-20365]